MTTKDCLHLDNPHLKPHASFKCHLQRMTPINNAYYEPLFT
jgi:hypothetical protein